MGFKIWRKDSSGWYLAFDAVFENKEKADEQVAELNAKYADRVKFGELSFHPYREDIKLSKDGSIIDPMLPTNKPKSKPFNNNKRRASRNGQRGTRAW
jgi:hypothetical protein